MQRESSCSTRREAREEQKFSVRTTRREPATSYRESLSRARDTDNCTVAIAAAPLARLPRRRCTEQIDIPLSKFFPAPRVLFYDG